MIDCDRADAVKLLDQCETEESDGLAAEWTVRYARESLSEIKRLTAELGQARAESARLLRQRELMAEEVREFLKDHSGRLTMKHMRRADEYESFAWAAKRVFAFRDRIAALASGEGVT